LLCYLALESPRGFQRRDSVVATFWPEDDAEQARHALRQALYFLRRTLGAAAIVSRGDDELAVATDVIRCDATEFERALDAGRLQEGLAFYRGELLPAFHVGDAPGFERWLDANPNGTTLLLDTIDVYMGAVHAAMAATSTESRRKAFKGFRVDSGDLAELGEWCLRFFEANGLPGLRPNLTGDLDVEKVRKIVAEFPEVAGFGIGTKLSSEVPAVAGVIFKQCLINGRPTLKASNSPEKITLPGRLQLFRGSDNKGNYVGDVIGLDGEDIDIPNATTIERLLVTFWENGQHSAIPSISKQKAFVGDQRKRFGDIKAYPHELSTQLRELRDQLTERMREDNSGWEEILAMPELNVR